MLRRFPFIFVAGLSLLLTACKQKKQEVPVSPDHLPALNTQQDAQSKPIVFLHKTFTVMKSVPFMVEVPPHSVIPRIH